MIVDKAEEEDIPGFETATKDTAAGMRMLHGFTEEEINAEFQRKEAKTAEHPAPAEGTDAGRTQEGAATSAAEEAVGQGARTDEGFEIGPRPEQFEAGRAALADAERRIFSRGLRGSGASQLGSAITRGFRVTNVDQAMRLDEGMALGGTYGRPLS